MHVVLLMAMGIATAIITAVVPAALSDTFKQEPASRRAGFLVVDIVCLGSLLLTLAHAWGWL